MLYSDVLYGSHEITGVFETLIQSSFFQRLQFIHQGGAIFLVNPQIRHTRFEHSVGVMLLIRQLGGSEKEQVAGLLHDLSHTAFSHVIDYVLNHQEEDFHEKWFAYFLQQPEISSILEAYGYTSDEFLTGSFPILEQPLPHLCADRLDYTLRDLYWAGLLTLKEIHAFLENVMVYKNRMVVTSLAAARWIKEKYTVLNQEYFQKKEHLYANQKLAELLRELLEHNFLLEDDFFQNDTHVINLIDFSLHARMKLDKIRSMSDFNPIVPSNIILKKREIDPEILEHGRVYRLSERQG
ncbi:HD domain-containing protein [Siphonobacter sp.]|uniref:HD domain-containing protein n=1 Tax=Siphonobacter sp. TaxID=1869184 RepID=UPI003B3A3A41